MTVLTKLTMTEWRLFRREPAALFFMIAFSPLLLVILGLVPSFREPSEDYGGLRVIDLYTPIILSMAIAMLALNALPMMFATYREQGILRRLATTPVRPAAMLIAQLALCTVLALVMMVSVLAIARLAFDVPLPDQIAGYLISFLLCVVAMLTLGLLVASLAPSGKSAGAIGSVLFFPVLFFAGLYGPRENMPEVLRKISDFTPLGAGVQSLQDTATGHWPQLLHVAVMLGWTVVVGGLAARYFRWE